MLIIIKINYFLEPLGFCFVLSIDFCDSQILIKIY